MFSLDADYGNPGISLPLFCFALFFVFVWFLVVGAEIISKI